MEVAHGGQLVKENMMATADAVEDLRDALPAEFDAFARGGDGALDDMPSPLVSADSFAGLLDGAERLKLSPSNLTAVAEAPANMNAAGQEDAAVLGTGPPLPPPVAGAVEKKPKRVVHRRDPDKRREQNRAASRRYRERARLRDALGSAARFAAAASTNVDLFAQQVGSMGSGGVPAHYAPAYGSDPAAYLSHRPSQPMHALSGYEFSAQAGALLSPLSPGESSGASGAIGAGATPPPPPPPPHVPVVSEAGATGAFLPPGLYPVPSQHDRGQHSGYGAAITHMRTAAAGADAHAARPNASGAAEKTHANLLRGRLRHDQREELGKKLDQLALFVPGYNNPQAHVDGYNQNAIEIGANIWINRLFDERRKWMLQEEIELITKSDRNEVKPLIRFVENVDARQIMAQQAAIKGFPTSIVSPLGWTEHIASLVGVPPTNEQRGELLRIEREAAAALLPAFAAQPAFVDAINSMYPQGASGARLERVRGGITGAMRNAATWLMRQTRPHGAVESTVAQLPNATMIIDTPSLENMRQGLLNSAQSFLQLAREASAAGGLSVGGGGAYHAEMAASGVAIGSPEGILAAQAEAMAIIGRAMREWFQRLTPIQKARMLVVLRAENPEPAELPGPLLTLLSPFFTQSLFLMLLGENPAAHVGCWGSKSWLEDPTPGNVIPAGFTM